MSIDATRVRGPIRGVLANIMNGEGLLLYDEPTS